MTRLPPLRAPQADGAILALPALEQAGSMIERNRKQIAAWTGEWGEWIDQARVELRELTGSASDPGQPFLLAGHQPELFHPGVWLKNFALAGLARRHQATAVNLVVDNDAVKSLSLAIPLPPYGDSPPRRIDLAFANADPETPWEECIVDDLDFFHSFGDRVAERMRPWGFEPLITTFWPVVCRHLQQGSIGNTFAAARRELEAVWGCKILELRLSDLCQTVAFARFVRLLIADPQRLVALYNEALRAFRKRNRLRSKNHPVPDLVIDGDRAEMPLWTWRADRGPVRRGRLFARMHGDRVELSRDGRDVVGVVSVDRPDTILELLRGSTWKIRTRALTTTMFARLFLGDLFVHGIGGAKYDELTDDIIRRVAGIDAPEFLVLTGTLFLPLPVPETSSESVERQARLVRDLDWNPQRYLSPEQAASMSQLIDEKQAWITRSPATSLERKERFRRLQELNRLLRPAVAEKRQDGERMLDVALQDLAIRQALRRRDYSFCLYPEGQLRAFFTSVL